VTITPRQFEVQPSSGVPIYLQIVEQVNALVVGGHLQSGEMLPSVRQMAAELSVNHMTISKAYSRLEASGVVERVRGKGMMLKESPITGTLKNRQSQLQPLMEQAVIRARQLGLNDTQILAVLKTVLQEMQ
jgi:GntR family transcriptional regulator